MSSEKTKTKKLLQWKDTKYKEEIVKKKKKSVLILRSPPYTVL